MIAVEYFPHLLHTVILLLFKESPQEKIMLHCFQVITQLLAADPQVLDRSLQIIRGFFIMQQ